MITFFRSIPLIIFQICFLLEVWYFSINFLMYGNWNLRKYLLCFFYLIITGALLLAGMYFHAFRFANVKEEKLALYVGPDKAYPIKMYLNLTDPVWIKKEYVSGCDKWFYVYINNKKGWINALGVEVK